MIESTLNAIDTFVKSKYDKDTYDHARRVMIYTRHNYGIFTENNIGDINFLSALALCHDLVEDTETTYDEIIDVLVSENASTITIYRFLRNLRMLTRDENVTYEKYILNISSKRHAYIPAYMVKIADMKDHLSLKETLTPKLKEKYISALAELL